MARAAHPGELGAEARPHRLFTLNTDGQHHPRENTGSALTALFAVVSVVCALIHPLHAVASWFGLAGLLTAMWAQMISATTAERFVNVCAAVLAGLGLLFGLAHGGLY